MIARGEQMLACRRARLSASPAFLQGGFRPFFFLGASWAIIALILWIFTFSGDVALPSALDPMIWHRHEMLFGYVGAIIAGFLLTAIPNWTDRPPIAGWPLGGFVGLWVAARIAVLFSAWTGMLAAAMIDVGFYFLLTLFATREVIATKNRNLPPVVFVFLMGVSNATDHLAAAQLIPDAELGIRGGISVVVMLITLIGGRIIPAFTRNWMTKHGITLHLSTQPTHFDLAASVMTAVALTGWIAAPTSLLAAGFLVAAGCAQAVRLSRWGGRRSVRDPLVLVLHIGYLWIPIGLLLLGASIFGTSVPRSAAIHALIAGAMATMTLAVMTRVILGHTGRELVANRMTAMIYVLVTSGAVLRIGASVGVVGYTVGMKVAAGAWGGAFGLFLVAYGPTLFRPRLDGN